MTIDTQKLREALDQIEAALHDAYQNAGQGCCGHGYGECCGNPEPVWDVADQKIMYVLEPIHRMVSDAVSQVDAQAAHIARLRDGIEEAIRLLGMDRPIDPTDTLRAALSGESKC